jgi:WhiB family transcriptional regulator, redox-sensing transcriptional regulator
MKIPMWKLVKSTEEWRLHAHCRDADPDIFFHPEGERGGARRRRDRAAKQICSNCSVARQCAQYSIAAAEPYGTWGGVTETERMLDSGSRRSAGGRR